MRQWQDLLLGEIIFESLGRFEVLMNSSITHIISGCLILPFGWLLEQPRFKKSPIGLVIANAALLVAHSLFLLQLLGPIVPVSLLGLGNGLFGTAFWPCVATIILENALPMPGRYEPVPQHFNPGIGHELSFIPHQPDSHYTADQFSRSHNVDLDEEGSGKPKSSEDLLVVAYGIMTSLVNLSVATMPAILAITKTMAGFTGIETVFVALSIGGIFASLRLVGIWKWISTAGKGRKADRWSRPIEE